MQFNPIPDRALLTAGRGQNSAGRPQNREVPPQYKHWESFKLWRNLTMEFNIQH